jgi:hypothetical protein
MARFLKDTGNGAPIPEPAIQTEDPQTLRCFPGSSRPDDFTTIPRFAAAAAKKLLAQRPAPADAHAWHAQRAAILQGLKTSLFGGDPPTFTQKALIAATQAGTTRTMTFQPEPGLTLTARQEPWSPSCNKLAVLLDLDGAEAEAQGPLARALRGDGWSVLTADLRATGKLADPHDRIGRAPDHNTAEWSLWLGRPLLGQWVVDVRRLLDALKENDGKLPSEVLVAGVGPAGLAAICAAAVDWRITRVATSGMLASYVTDEPYQGQRLGIMAPGILRDAGDVAHLASIVAPRTLVVAGGVTGGGKPLDEAALHRVFEVTRQAYAIEGTVDQFHLLPTANPARIVQAVDLEGQRRSVDPASGVPDRDVLEPARTKWLEVVIPPQADKLERFAASELQRYLVQLFGVRVHLVPAATASADCVFFLGTVGRNSARALGQEQFPPLSEQGFLLRTTRTANKPVMTIAGGSPAATLWAVYELVERWGVRYLLSGDVFPAEQPDFVLPQIDKVFEPGLRLRWWRTMGDFAMGTEGWGMADYRPLINQLAKLKINRIRVGSGPSQPFLHLDIQGVQQRFATLWYGYHYPITQDMPGRKLFGNTKEFWNPDLPMPEDGYEKLAAAGQRHCHALIAYAHDRGMEASFVGSILDFPKEFRALIPDARVINQLGELTVGPGPAARPDSEQLRALSGAVIRTMIDTYPEADSYGFPVGTEWRSWVDLHAWAWREMDTTCRIHEATSLEQVLRNAKQRTDYPGGAERAVQEVKGDITGLYFLNRLWSDPEFVKKSKKPNARLVVYEPAEELFPILSRVLPRGSELMIVVDYTATALLRRRGVLGHVPAKEVPTTLVLLLQEDNIGVVPQLTTGSLHELLGEMRKNGLAGFCTRQWMISDLDPCAAYLSKAAWDAGVTPAMVYRDQIRSVCGDAVVAPMLETFRELEAVTIDLEDHDLGLSFPVPGMIMKHWSAGPLEERHARYRNGYRRALAAAKQVPELRRPEGRTYVRYWIGRLGFGVGYIDTIEAIKKAATAEKEAGNAKAKGDPRRAKTKLREAAALARAAQKSAFQAIESLAAVAKNRADCGAIATMAEYVYRPLKHKADELQTEYDKMR